MSTPAATITARVPPAARRLSSSAPPHTLDEATAQARPQLGSGDVAVGGGEPDAVVVDDEHALISLGEGRDVNPLCTRRDCVCKQVAEDKPKGIRRDRELAGHAGDDFGVTSPRSAIACCTSPPGTRRRWRPDPRAPPRGSSRRARARASGHRGGPRRGERPGATISRRVRRGPRNRRVPPSFEQVGRRALRAVLPSTFLLRSPASAASPRRRRDREAFGSRPRRGRSSRRSRVRRSRRRALRARYRTPPRSGQPAARRPEVRQAAAQPQNRSRRRGRCRPARPLVGGPTPRRRPDPTSRRRRRP